MTDTENTMRATPKQGRAQARVEAIVAAGHQHFDAVGRDRFNLSGVHAIAGGSIGSIYRYFKDRYALLEVVDPTPAHTEKVVEKVVQVPAELTAEQHEKIEYADNVKETISALTEWAERLVDKGEGKGDLKAAGQAILKIMNEKGVLE